LISNFSTAFELSRRPETSSFRHGSPWHPCGAGIGCLAYPGLPSLRSAQGKLWAVLCRRCAAGVWSGGVRGSSPARVCIGVGNVEPGCGEVLRGVCLAAFQPLGFQGRRLLAARLEVGPFPILACAKSDSVRLCRRCAAGVWRGGVSWSSPARLHWSRERRARMRRSSSAVFASRPFSRHFGRKPPQTCHTRNIEAKLGGPRSMAGRPGRSRMRSGDRRKAS